MPPRNPADLASDFTNLPSDAKSRDDLARLALNDSLKQELTTCFETLPCPCQFNEHQIDDIRKIYLEPTDRNSDGYTGCEIDINSNDNSRVQFSVNTEVDEAITVYSCHIKVNVKIVSELEHMVYTWNAKCRFQLTDYATAKAEFFA